MFLLITYLFRPYMTQPYFRCYLILVPKSFPETGFVVLSLPCRPCRHVRRTGGSLQANKHTQCFDKARRQWGPRESEYYSPHTAVNGQCYIFSNTKTLRAAVSGLKSPPSRCGSSLRVCKQVQICIKETWNISALEYKKQLNPTYNPVPQSRCRSATKYYYYQFVCWCFSSIISSVTLYNVRK